MIRTHSSHTEDGAKSVMFGGHRALIDVLPAGCLRGGMSGRAPDAGGYPKRREKTSGQARKEDPVLRESGVGWWVVVRNWRGGTSLVVVHE